MRALHLVAHGEPPVHAEIKPPVRPPGQVLVAPTAVPVTPLDILCATGQSYFGPPALPYVPGVQGVGMVVESEALTPGTRVWFATTAGMAPGNGSLAELACATEGDVIPLPEGVPDAVVAAVGLSGIAAWMALTSRGALQPGESVLVLGAGVVGQVALQAALALGAPRVVVAARSADSRELALSYGAHAVVELRAEDDVAGLAARMKEACGGPVDLVIDPLCGMPASAALEVLAPDGRLVNLGGSAGATAEFASATLRSRSASILGYTNNALTAAQRTEALAAVLRHVVEDGLTVAHEVVGWEHGPGGWAAQATGRARRRVVIAAGS